MAIDRVARARKRWALRNAADGPPRSPGSAASAGMEIDGLFNPGRKHQLERLEWVAVAREDERESGEGPLDLDDPVIRLPRR